MRKEGPEVYYLDERLPLADGDTVALIKRIAPTTPRLRCRICFHPDPQARTQEMLIAMHASSYVPPHRHLDKTETLTVLEGWATTLLFDQDGAITQRSPMGPYGSGRAFFYRMPERTFHTLRFESEWFIYLETTTGPFDPARSEHATWAPPEHETEAGLAYVAALADQWRPA